MMAGRACRPSGSASTGFEQVAASAAPEPLGLLEWAETAVAPLRPAAHHSMLLAALSDVEAGRSGRLLVLMPPGSAKSTYSSVVFPAWWLHRNPTANIVAASHTETLAHHFGRQVRGLVAEHADRLGLALARDDRAAGRWSVRPADGGRGGDYFAAGVRGPITGRRADLVLIDDPIRSHAEAESAGSRESLWQWFQADLLPRLKPRGSVVLIMTRWHEDDLAGRLLSLNDAGLWRVLRLPALAEAGDPMGRVPGEALWPEWEDAEALAAKRVAVGERVWASLFQQSPRPDAGTLFRPERVATVDAVPPCVRVVRAWDLAATVATTGRDPDWTAGVKLGRTAEGALCVMRLPVRFVAAGRRAGSLPHPLHEAVLDGAYVRVGDVLVDGDGERWIVAAREVFLPALCVRAPRTVGIQRSGGQAFVGVVDYGGGAATVPLLDGWPASMVASGGGVDGAGIPGDVAAGCWSVLLPLLPAAVVPRAGDVLGDDLGRSGVLTVAEPTANGWHLTVRQAVP